MKLLFKWLFVALPEVAWEGSPGPERIRKLRAFLFCIMADTGDECWGFQICLHTCLSSGVWLRRNQPRICVEKEVIPWEHQPAAPAPDECRNSLSKAERGSQEHSLPVQPHPLVDLFQ